MTVATARGRSTRCRAGCERFAAPCATASNGVVGGAMGSVRLSGIDRGFHREQRCVFPLAGRLSAADQLDTVDLL